MSEYVLILISKVSTYSVQDSSSAVFHFWGGMFVAVFLILSGYGINESFHKHGLKDYWHKRLTKVVVPTLVFASCFSLFDPQRNMQTLVNEVLSCCS